MTPVAPDLIVVASGNDERRATLTRWSVGRGLAVCECKTLAELISAVRLPRVRLIVLHDDIGSVSATNASLQVRWHAARAPLLLIASEPTAEEIRHAMDAGASVLVSADDFDRVFMYADALIAREQAPPPPVIRRGPFLLDVQRRCIEVEGSRIRLTHGQAKIFAFLCLHANTIVRTEELVGEIDCLVPNESSLKAMAQQLFRLRKRLGRWGDRIQTLRGSGYVLTVSDAATKMRM